MNTLWRAVRMVVLLALLAAIPASAVEYYLSHAVSHPDTVVMIEPGQSVMQIARTLAASGVIRYPTLFVAYARLTKKDRVLKAGEYVFEDGLTPRQVVGKMVRGEFRTFQITFPEGLTMRQMADYLEKQPFVTVPGFGADFLAAARDPARIAALGIEADSLEGFLFPDTYRIHRPKKAAEIVDLLVAAFRQQFDAGLQAQAAARGLSMRQAVTLASIIEKETGAAHERALVSAVFHNRLKKGMKLETDPTVVYGIPDYDGIIHRSDLDNPHPYNTYIHAGLPPGPIANPGRAALEAAVNPADVPYLYFVSKNDGTHIFSEHYGNHTRAVQQYQRQSKEEAE